MKRIDAQNNLELQEHDRSVSNRPVRPPVLLLQGASNGNQTESTIFRFLDLGGIGMIVLSGGWCRPRPL